MMKKLFHHHHHETTDVFEEEEFFDHTFEHEDLHHKRDKHVIEERHSTKHITSKPVEQVHHDSQGVVTHKKVAPAIEETMIRPAIVKNSYRTEEVIEVQPVIHRIIDAPEVHHIERHVYEIQQPTFPKVITKEPIIVDVIRPRIIEEVQTIVHREVAETLVVHEETHINEHVVRPIEYTKEVLHDDQVRTVSGVDTQTTISTQQTTVPHLAHKHVTIAPDTSIPESQQTTYFQTYASDTTYTSQAPSSEQVQAAHATYETQTVAWVRATPRAWSHTFTKKSKGKSSDKDKSKGKSSDKGKSADKSKATKKEKPETTPDAALTTPIPQSPECAISVDTFKKEEEVPLTERPFVERVPVTTSLDLRAQFSLERRAELQGQNEMSAFAPVPHKAHSATHDRVESDLERGSQIGCGYWPCDKIADEKKEKEAEKEEEEEKEKSEGKSKGKDKVKEAAKDTKKSDNKEKEKVKSEGKEKEKTKEKSEKVVKKMDDKEKEKSKERTKNDKVNESAKDLKKGDKKELEEDAKEKEKQREKREGKKKVVSAAPEH